MTMNEFAHESLPNRAAPRDYFPEDVTAFAPTDVLPDLFAFLDGERRVETAEDWRERREELSDLMQYYLYGCKHETPPSASVLRELSEEEKDALTIETEFFGMTFKRRPEVLVEVTDCGRTAAIKLDAFVLPEESARGAEPCGGVICIGGLPPQQVETLRRNGYAYISLNTASVYSDGGNNPRTGAYNELYPYRAGEYEFDSGVLTGWAWGVSRIVDALKNDAAGAKRWNVAWDKIAVTGCSRNGKAAVLAAAFDERVAIAAPSDPGAGGLTGFRYSTEGKLWNYALPREADTVYSRNESVQRAIANPDEAAWFTSRAQQITGESYRHVPFDLHAVAALVAPRPLICWTGETQQSWLNSPATVLNVHAAAELYEFLGAGGNVACVVRDGAHANQDRDLPDLIAIMDYTFGRSDTLVRRAFATLMNDDGTALDGSGSIKAEETFDCVARLWHNPYILKNGHKPWARPNKYTLWSETTSYLMHGDLPVLHTDAFEIEFMPYADGRVSVRAVGNFKDANEIAFVVYTERDALRHGLNLTGGSPDGAAIGFTSPILTAPRLFVNGAELTTSVHDDGSTGGYLERFGVSLKPRGAEEIAVGETLTFAASGIRLEVMPKFALAISVELTKTETEWFGRKSVAFTSPFGETPSWRCDASRAIEPPSGEELLPNFAARVIVADTRSVTVAFDEPMNPNEFGVALDAAEQWSTQWAADCRLVRLEFAEPIGACAEVTVYLFRLVNADGRMLPGPIKLVYEPSTATQLTRVLDESLPPEAFRVDGETLTVAASDDAGELYGKYYFEERVRLGDDARTIAFESAPTAKFRVLNHWDNMDGSVERGYAGRSLFFRDGALEWDEESVVQYAELLARVGINGICINNVNVRADSRLLITQQHLSRLAQLAAVLRPYHVRLIIAVDFAAPKTVGGLETCDPLDARVAAWWREAAARVYEHVPDLMGFLVKADSEFQSGPAALGRTQADGANALAAAMEPYGGVIFWRCFVYDCLQDWRDKVTDRPKAAYEHFAPLDGAFAENVVLQIKIGPVDFQVHEPLSPLLGALKSTRRGIEFQITQEYTGQQIDLYAHAVPWSRSLRCEARNGVPLAELFGVDGLEAVMGVANVGDDENWTGNPLALANLYAFGKLAWNPHAGAERILCDWVTLTFGDDETVTEPITRLLMESHDVYAKYNAPLGIGWMVNPGHHYGVNVDGYEYAKWGTYHRASHDAIGVDRTATGTRFTAQYDAELAAVFDDPQTCPQELLLFFHRLPYDFRLRSGETLIQYIYDTHFEGAEDVRRFAETWAALEEKLPSDVFSVVAQRFERQLENAVEWRDVINTYFRRLTGIDDEKGRRIEE